MKTGLHTFLMLSRRFCVFFGRYEATIRTAIAATSLSTEDKNRLYASIDAIKSACSAVELIRVRWE